jgi:hypothetical protein
MTETITTAAIRPNNFFKAFFLTGLLAGSLDATAAMTQFMIRTHGNDPLKVWRYVASGVLGQDVMTKNIWMIAALGLLFHFCIAFSFTLFFYLIYPKIKFLSKNLLITGFGYGIFVWLVMNLLIVPLSNVPSKGKLWTSITDPDGSTHTAFQFPLDPTQMIIGILIIMFCVGLPISLLAGRYYSRRLQH